VTTPTQPPDDNVDVDDSVVEAEEDDAEQDDAEEEDEP